MRRLEAGGLVVRAGLLCNCRSERTALSDHLGSAAANRWHQMDFAIGANGREPRVLKDLAVDGDGITGFEMRAELGITAAELAQQLTHVAGFDFDLGRATRQLFEGAAQDDVCQAGNPYIFEARAASIASSTRGGDIGSAVKRMPVAFSTAFAMAAIGGTIGVSPTPRTP